MATLISTLYQFLVKQILIQRYGSNFGGFVSGKDARMATGDLSKTIANILYFVDFNTRDNRTVYNLLLDKLAIIFELDIDPKVSCSLHKQFGHCYFLRNQIKHDDVLSTFSDSLNTKLISMKSVQEFLSCNSCVKLPKNNAALFEFILSEKPINYKGSQTTFAIIFRFQHCIMDGPAFLHFMFYTNLLSGDRPKQFVSFKQPDKFKEDILSTVFKIATGSCDVLTLDTLRKTEWNPFHWGESSGNKLLQWRSEGGIDTFKKIKEIKERTGVSITNILTVVIAVSLKLFAKKRNRKLESLTTVQTIQSKSLDFTKPTKLTNTFSIDLFRYSLNSLKIYGLTINNIKEFLNNYIQCYEAFISTNLSSVVETYINLFAKVIPLPILNIFKLRNVTLLFTNLGTLDEVKFLSYDLKEMFCFSHNDGQLGLMFTALTHRGTLTICISCDRKYLQDIQEVDEVLKTVFQNINQLHHEVISNK